MPDWIPRRTFRTWPREGESRLVDFPLVNDELALLWMVQMHCIDMNAWYSRVDRPERPDFVLFDLDPPDGGFPDAIRVAHLIRELMDELGLESHVKTSGADGIHVVVPDRAPLRLPGDVRVRGGGLAAARGAARRARDDRVAEAQAARRARRPPPERPRQDDRVRVLGPAEAGRAASRRRSTGTSSPTTSGPATSRCRRRSSAWSGSATSGSRCSRPARRSAALSRSFASRDRSHGPLRRAMLDAVRARS